ncbi:MAG TPA: hypothetical protein VMW66_01100 [Elusimicrobiales bacterium]|nr:hypothetical protein [Elusimicrobiales bacterium]
MNILAEGNNFLYFCIFGFLASFTALFYFTALYKQILLKGKKKGKKNFTVNKKQTDDENKSNIPESTSSAEVNPTVEKSAIMADDAIIPAEVVSVDEIKNRISEFSNKINEMKGNVEEKKNLQEAQIKQIVLEINSLVKRIEKLDPEYVSQIDSSLNAVIKDLEQVRKLTNPSQPL